MKGLVDRRNSMSRRYRNASFDTPEEREKWIKDVIDCDQNQLDPYPMWVSDLFEANGKFVVEYAC
jgi:hypothetical protein